MSTSRKWSMSIAALVFAMGIFLLLALVSFQREHYDNPDGYKNLTAFYSVSKTLFSSLGGAAYLDLATGAAVSVDPVTPPAEAASRAWSSRASSESAPGVGGSTLMAVISPAMRP